jgi:hypothetical protein
VTYSWLVVPEQRVVLDQKPTAFPSAATARRAGVRVLEQVAAALRHRPAHRPENVVVPTAHPISAAKRRWKESSTDASGGFPMQQREREPNVREGTCTRRLLRRPIHEQHQPVALAHRRQPRVLHAHSKYKQIQNTQRIRESFRRGGVRRRPSVSSASAARRRSARRTAASPQSPH